MPSSERPVDVSTVDGNAPYFAFSASLRIHGDIVDFNEISETLGLQPSRVHRRGERKGANSPAYRDDAWQYDAPIPEDRPLDEHIQALWAALEQHKTYLLQLKQHLKIDVFCGYRTNHWGAGFQIEPQSLAMFTALQIPFGVSVIVSYVPPQLPCVIPAKAGTQGHGLDLGGGSRFAALAGRHDRF
jgi:Domain of unknown function (DUF4279)